MRKPRRLGSPGLRREDGSRQNEAPGRVSVLSGASEP
jgi:hypothetical protein